MAIKRRVSPSSFRAAIRGESGPSLFVQQIDFRHACGSHLEKPRRSRRPQKAREIPAEAGQSRFEFLVTLYATQKGFEPHVNRSKT
jgi:hypothetical protein